MRWGDAMMQCRKCGFDNPSGMKFSGACAMPLALACLQCGFANPAGFKFCGQCAAALGTAGSGPEPPATPAKARTTPAQLALAQPGDPRGEEPGGERKTVTAMFADIHNSTGLEEGLDPEEARALVDPALRLMIDAVHHFEGYIVQSTGDGIFAIFGAPIAYEDHLPRAVYAALRLQEQIRRYGARLREEGRQPITVRVGVNTGEVVVRSIQTGAGQIEYTPIGRTANLAARLQTVATPGSVVVSERSARLAEGYFRLRPLGPVRLKGISDPVSVYEVGGLGNLRTRLQRAADRGLTKFVGRDAEMIILRKAGEAAGAGHGKIVAVVGDAGVGKSRLFHEFKAIAQGTSVVMEAFSVSHGKSSVYLPAIELLRGYFRIVAEDDERTRREKITGKVLALDRSLEDTLPYLFGLLGLSEDDEALLQMDPRTRKRRTLEAIRRLMLRESLNQPVTVIFEDLHWIDEETQALLNLLADSIGTARLLLLVNYRPEYRHDWSNKGYYQQLRLEPLGSKHAQELLSALLGDGPALNPLKRLIVERADGNPFFMEELVQEFFEQTVLVRNGTVRLAKPISEVRLPPTVEGILASRIDRLTPTQKDLLQTLAVIGKEFALTLVKAVLQQQQEEELERLLETLRAGEFIYEQPAVTDVLYTFKHALTQEVAYGSLLFERRRVLHERVARTIEVLFAHQIEDHLNELAFHYSRSSNAAEAVRYLRLAGAQATRRSAYAPAVQHFARGLELIPALGARADSAGQELELQIGLGQSMAVLKGYAAPEAQQPLNRALKLCQSDDSAHLFPVLYGLWLYHHYRLELKTAQEHAGRLLSISQAAADPGGLLIAHSSWGESSLWLGEFSSALGHLDQASALVRSGRAGRGFLEADASTACMTLLAWNQWFLGRPNQAINANRFALTTAVQEADPYSQALGLVFSTLLLRMLRVPDGGLAQAERALAVATQQDSPLLAAEARVERGAALVDHGRSDEGFAELRRGMSEYEATGAVVNPWQFALLADACARVQSGEEGLKAVERGLDQVHHTGERMFEAELYRLKGELLLMRATPDASEAERCLRSAIDVAREQSALSWELRATTSLARLLADNGRRDEASESLAAVHGRFTEGFETADLKDAQTMLERLRSA